MSNKKLEVIRRAYGNKYDLLKKDISHNGIILSSDLKEKLSQEEIRDMLLETVVEGSYPEYDDLMRPKVLGGIENNNGWLSIEEHGLPKKDNEYCVFLKSDFITEWTFTNGTTNEYWLERVSHYKPKENKLKPLY